MADHCAACPFAGCGDCETPGGADTPSREDEKLPLTWDNGANRTNGSAPDLRQQNEGLTTGTHLPDVDREESPVATLSIDPRPCTTHAPQGVSRGA